MCQINFTTKDRDAWVKEIATFQDAIIAGTPRNNYVTINIASEIVPEDLHPVHLVLLACLTRLLRKNNFNCTLVANKSLIEYFRDDLHLETYFNTDAKHVEGRVITDLNLWRVERSESILYSERVANYLKSNHLKGKDLSLLKVILDELYANIADHSQAEDVAYSYIHYDYKTEVIQIAFCDFGIGIPNSIKKANLTTTKGYIQLATKKGISAKSNTHNKGFGLDTVVSSIANTNNVISIISGNELYISYGTDAHDRTWSRTYDFNGTLIYFDLPIASFEDADYVEEFEL